MRPFSMMVIATLAMPALALYANITYPFADPSDTNYFRVIRDDATNLVWSNASGWDGNAGLLVDTANIDDGMANWLYDQDGYGAGSNVYEEGWFALDFNLLQLSQPVKMLFALTPQDCIKICFEVRASDRRMNIYTNCNETTDWSQGAVKVAERYNYSVQLNTQQWQKIRASFGTVVSGSDKFRWVLAEVFDHASNGVTRVDLAWTNSVPNEYTAPLEVGFGKSRSYSGSGTILLLDNFSVVPEPALLLPLLLMLGCLKSRNLRLRMGRT